MASNRGAGEEFPSKSFRSSSGGWSGLTGNTWPYLVLLAEVLIFYRFVLFYDGYVIPWDMRWDHFPIATFMAESFRNGELPLWDPFTYCGRPLFANIQSQLFYPPTFLAIAASNWTAADDLLYAMEWQSVLHVFLGGAFTYVLMRHLGTSRAAALVAGTIYQLGGYFPSQAQHLVGTDVAGWMPLTWLGVLALRKGWDIRWAAALAFGLAMSVFAGLPAQMAITFTACGLLAVLLIVFRLAPPRLLATVLGCCAFALLLAAVQFIPTAQLTFLSVAQYRTDWLGTGGGLPLASLASLVWPNYYGIFDLATYKHPWDPTFLYVYCSWGGLLLTVAAMTARRTRESAMFALLTVISVFWMLGDQTVVGRWVFAVLPQQVQIGLHPEFALAVFVLSMAVMAGLGAEQFLRRPPLQYAAVAIIALDLTLVGSGRAMNAFPIAIEPGVAHHHFDGHPEILNGVREVIHRTDPPARIDTLGDSLNWAMSAPLMKIPSANGNDPFALARLIQVRLAFCEGERWGRWYEVSWLDSPVLDLVNVGAVLSRDPLDAAQVAQARFVEAPEVPGHHIYENTEVLPRFFLVGRVRRAGEMAEAVKILHSAEFDPRNEAVVEGDFEFADSLDAGAGDVRVVEYSPRRVVLETDSPAPAFLVTSENHYPGWNASIDGEKRPLYYTNVSFRGLPVPAGRHEIEMHFDPPILKYSGGISLLTWGVFALLAIRSRRSAHRKR